jgi:probable F420-dependent oxidoreductase
VELGVMLPTVGPLGDRDTLIRIARTAEDAGLTSVWIPDHVVIPASRESVYPYPQSKTEGAFVPGVQWLDPIAAMGVIAGATDRIRIGTAVLILPLRRALVLANEIASLDRLSNGRLEFGTGVGWLAEEFAAIGADFATRGKAGDEFVEAMRLLWTSAGPCSYDGDIVSFHDVVLGTRPVQENGPPIWVGGHTPPALRRAVRLGDGWHGFEASVDDMRGYRKQLDEYCNKAGRDPATLRASVHRTLLPPFDVYNGLPERPVVRADEAVDMFGEYASLGVDLIVLDLAFLPDDVCKTLEWVGAELIPQLQ